MFPATFTVRVKTFHASEDRKIQRVQKPRSFVMILLVLDRKRLSASLKRPSSALHIILEETVRDDVLRLVPSTHPQLSHEQLPDSMPPSPAYFRMLL